MKYLVTVEYTPTSYMARTTSYETTEAPNVSGSWIELTMHDRSLILPSQAVLSIEVKDIPDA